MTTLVRRTFARNYLLALALVAGACAPTVVPPEASVPKDLAAFSGTWVGVWGQAPDRVDTMLVIQKIEPPFATVFYEWSANPVRDLQPGSTYERGKFDNGVLTIAFTNGAVLAVRMNPNDTLAGTYAFHDIRSQSTLVRKP
jgi:hypothetical protein